MRSPGSVASVIPRNRYVAIIAIIALCLSIIELADLFEIPFEGLASGASSSSFFSSARVVALMTSLGYVSLFVLMTLESASLPIPSEVVLPFAGYLVYAGVMNFGAALAISTTAALAGALIDYYLALLLGRVFVEGLLRRFGIERGALARAQKWFEGKGAWTVFGARFVPVLRSLISLPAGLFKMPVKSFVLLTVLGCLCWNAVLIYAGFAAGALWDKVVGSSSSLLTSLLLIAIAVASVLYLAFYAYVVWRGWMTKSTTM
ncbi:MAG: DedA family protein [Nitrososphaerales archaeon]|nr:DedA family protein [Nitrososphaerales archaeon]